MKKEGVTLKRLIADYFDGLREGEKFSPSDVRAYVVKITDGERNPMDGTITRIMRFLRDEGWEWTVEDKANAVYRRGKKLVTGSECKKGVIKPQPYSYRY